MKKYIFFLILIIYVQFNVFSLSKIKLGYSTNQNDPRGIAAKLFKEEVEKKTNGKIMIEIYHSGKLGSDTELIEGIINGNVDMTVSSAGNFAVHCTNVGISALPFLFNDFEKAWKFMDSQFITDINKNLEDYNILVLSHFDNGFRCVTTTKKQINTVKDMEGLKIRTPSNNTVIETMLALGANPETMSFNELPVALKIGLFDSQENPIPVIYSSKLYLVQKYLAITNHSYDAMPFVIRKDLWQSLNPSEQRILKDAALKAQEFNRKIVKEQTENLLDELKNEGMIITKPDLSEFAQKTKTVLNMFSEIYGKKLMEIVMSFK